VGVLVTSRRHLVAQEYAADGPQAQQLEVVHRPSLLQMTSLQRMMTSFVARRVESVSPRVISVWSSLAVISHAARGHLLDTNAVLLTKSVPRRTHADFLVAIAFLLLHLPNLANSVLVSLVSLLVLAETPMVLPQDRFAANKTPSLRN